MRQKRLALIGRWGGRLRDDQVIRRRNHYSLQGHGCALCDSHALGCVPQPCNTASSTMTPA